MPSLQQMATREGAFSGGHRLCAGCPVPVITKMLTRVTDYEIVAGNATGCLEVASSIFPYSAWKIPWIHTAFENAAASMSGVEAMYRSLRKQGRIDKKIKFVVIGGDGGTYDIGIQALSGAMERGHDLLYICYDNGAYMNTGIQRSGATPIGAATMTSPAGKNSPGKVQHRKDMTAIMISHNLPYIAQASIHNPVDLSEKIKKGIELDGPAFLNVLAPCVPGWKIDHNRAVEAARMGVDCCYWPLFEVENGRYTINYIPEKKASVREWIAMQGRFDHLKREGGDILIQRLEDQVEQQWQRLLDLSSCRPE